MIEHGAKKPHQKIIDEIIPLIILLEIALFFFQAPLFQGKSFVPADLLEYLQPWKNTITGPRSIHNSAVSDGILQFYPEKLFYSREIQNNRVPLWNPHSFSGQPFVANDKSAVFYPFNFLLYSRLPAWYAIGLSAALHLFLSGLFMYLFLRSLFLKAYPSLIGAAGYMLSSWFVGIMHITSRYDAAVWLPLVLCLYELSMRSGRWKIAVLSGVALGVQMLAGFFQSTAYLVLFLCVFAFWRAFSSRLRIKKVSGIKKHILNLTIVFFVAVLISMVQLLPTAEIFPEAARSAASLEKRSEAGVSTGFLASYFIPEFMGTSWKKRSMLVLAASYVEMNVYVGVSILFLAAMGLFIRGNRRKGITIFFAVTAVITLLTAAGTPLFALFYYLVPGAKATRPSRFLEIMPLCICALAALGVSEIIYSKRKSGSSEKHSVLAGILSFYFVAVAAIAAGILYLHNDLRIPMYAMWSIHGKKILFPIIFSTLTISAVALRNYLPQSAKILIFLFLVTIELLIYGRGVNTSVPPASVYFTTPSIDFLINKTRNSTPFRVNSYDFNTLSANTALAFGLDDIRGYDSLFPAGYKRLFTELDLAHRFKPVDSEGSAFTKVITHPLLDFMNVRYIISERKLAFPGLKPAFEGEVYIYENISSIPRAYFVSDWKIMNDETALKYLAGNSFNPAHEVVLSTDPLIKKSDINNNSETIINHIDSSDVDISIKADKPGLLVISNGWDKGWQAKNDGETTRILRANTAFCAIPIETAGSHNIHLSYSPFSVRLGFIVSLSTTLAVFLLLLLPGFKKSDNVCNEF